MRKISLLMLFLFAVITQAIGATKTVYFNNTENWSNVSIWVWQGSTNYTGGTWAGVKIIGNGNTLNPCVYQNNNDPLKDGSVTCAKEGDLFKVTIDVKDATSPKIIFNNIDDGQTDNLSLVDGRTYTCTSTDADFRDPDEPVSEFTEFYLTGDSADLGGWEPTDGYKFETTDGINYSVTISELSGTFKITDANWDINYGGATFTTNETKTATKNSGSNCQAKVTFTDVTISFVYANPTPDNIKITVNGTIEGEHGGDEDVYQDFYLVGTNTNNWHFEPEYEFATDDGIHYTLHVGDLYDNFKIATEGHAISYGDVRIDGAGTFVAKQNTSNNCYVPNGYEIKDATLSFVYDADNDATISISVEGTYQLLGGETPDEPQLPTSGHYILFKNDADWQKPYVWAWTSTANCTAAGKDGWPGDPMTIFDAANKLWIWKLPDGKPVPTQVIISNNGGTKAGNKDLDYHDKATYTSSGNYTEPEPPVVDPDDPTPVEGLSGTLPVMYITTDAILIDKDYKLKDKHQGTFYISVPEGCTWGNDYAVGSTSDQLGVTIKLRGNYTRTGFSKKPYKLKLNARTSLMGMPASKDYALLAHADDDKGFMRNFVGFELGKQIGLPWTPSQQPVEVVINGEYRGLYFLTESISVEPDRVNINKLADNEADAKLLSGGYLVELDNYREDPSIQLQLQEKSYVGGHTVGDLLVTFNTPEEVSDISRQFLTEQFSKMNDLVGSNSDDLWRYIDLDDAVRYYLVMELISHWEAFHGSTYMFRDRGEGQKWHFSPLWDCGNAFGCGTNNYFYNQDQFGNTWIPSMRANAKFNAKLKETWQWFLTNGYSQIMNKIDEYANLIDAAAKADAQKWEGYPIPDGNGTDPVNGNLLNPTDVMVNKDVKGRASWVKEQLSAKVNWLKTQNDFGALPASPAAEPARDTTPAAELPAYVKPDVEEPVEPTEPTHYIYYDNTGKGWDQPHVWAWDHNNGDANCNTHGWPGDPMTEVEGNANLWQWTLPDGKPVPTHLIISDGNDNKLGGGDLDYVNKATYDTNGNPIGGEIVYPTPTGMSGTLPVMYIFTDACLIDKDYLLKDKHRGKCYVEVPEGSLYGQEFKDKFGAPDDMLPLEIKLRGNYTRSGFSKKPYKLKFDGKQALLGLSKSKHFALIAHADDDKGFMRNYVGFELGKQIGLPWAPSQVPVEVVINGVYRGLYFLTESIRVEKDRVNITEIADGEVDNTKLSGGYLVELDNYEENDDKQIKMPEKGQVGVPYGAKLLVTFDTPEVVSPTARKFLTEQFTTMNDLVGSNSDDLWKYIDLDDAVRYYLVMELLNHGEAFHGSTYMYRDFGFKQKWHFSPLWDCGHAFEGEYNKFLYNQQGLYGNTWIPTLRTNAKFNAKLKETWRWFLTNCYDQIMDKIDNYAKLIDKAAKADHEVWKNAPRPSAAGPNGDYRDPVNGNLLNPTEVLTNNDVLSAKAPYVKEFLRNKVNWLKSQADFGSLDGGPWAEPERETTPFATLPDYVSPDYVAPVPVYVYVANADAKWNPNGNADFQLRAYFYNNESDQYTTWTNSPVMTYDADLTYTMNGVDYTGFYTIEIPDGYRDGRLIIYTDNGNGGRYPADQQQGMQLDGKNVFYIAGDDHLSDIDEPIVNHPWSGSLPVLVIDTADHVAIPADKTKVTAESYVINTDGTKTTAVALDIKGRGTDTWTNFDKKPYKLKYDGKQALLGLPKSKHFVLMPYASDGENALLANAVGHKLSKIAGLEWTPNEAPVELVINDEYLGLYYVVENVRPAGERVQVQDYSDRNKGVGYSMEDDWIIEVDNTVTGDVYSYNWTYGNATAHIVPNAPDFNDPSEIDAADYATLKGHFDAHLDALIAAVNEAATKNRSTDWMNIIDAREAARYIIVQELMDDANATNKSLFLHHTTGGKWLFGPVWDFSGAFASKGSKQSIIHSEASDAPFFRQLFNNIPFRDIVNEEFIRISGMDIEMPAPEQPENFDNVVLMDATDAPLTEIYSHIDEQAAKIADAAVADAVRWPQYAATSEGNTVADRADNIKQMLQSNAAYLATEWNSGTTGVGNVAVDSTSTDAPQYYDMMGRRVANPAAGNIYIIRRGATVTKQLVK